MKSVSGSTSKRPYPRKRDEERRIPVSFSLSDERLKFFREALSISLGHEPTPEEVRKVASSLALAAVDEAIKRVIEFNEAIII